MFMSKLYSSFPHGFELNDSQLTIQQISEQLNFSNQSFFGKFFKRCAGMSPKDYMNS